LLTGEYFHNIDDKGRMIFPSRLRDELGEKFYLAPWYGECIAAFSEEEWRKICDKITALPLKTRREFERKFSPKSCEVIPDKQGRILIPDKLRVLVGNTSDVAVVGVIDRAEIWNKETWLRKYGTLDTETFENMMLELDI